MLTIKWCSGFSEQIFHSVDVITANINHASDSYGLAFISRTPQSPELHHCLGADTRNPIEPDEPKGLRGVAFVMNEAGKTVAKYDL